MDSVCSCSPRSVLTYAAETQTSRISRSLFAPYDLTRSPLCFCLRQCRTRRTPGGPLWCVTRTLRNNMQKAGFHLRISMSICNIRGRSKMVVICTLYWKSFLTKGSILKSTLSRPVDYTAQLKTSLYQSHQPQVS